MDFPLLPVVLLALPFVAAAVILAVSRARRGTRGSGETAHRMQADTAAVQSAEVPPETEPRAVQPARERRAASAEEDPDA